MDEGSIDEAAKKAVVVSGTSSSVLERASKDDVHGLQAYTIRKMDQYMPTGKDIDHYKLLSASERPSEVSGCIMFSVPVSYRAVWRVSSSYSQTDVL